MLLLTRLQACLSFPSHTVQISALPSFLDSLSVLVSDRKSLYLHASRSVCLHADASVCSCASLCMCFSLSSRISVSSLYLFFLALCVCACVFVREKTPLCVHASLSPSLTLCCGSLCCVTVSHFTPLRAHVCVCVCLQLS